MKKIVSKFFRVCPKTGRIIGLKPLSWLTPWVFPIVGFIALIWVIIRVGPKPSRARYPCQRVAIPLATQFLIWVFGPVITTMALSKIYRWFVQGQFIKVAFCFVLCATLLSGTTASGENGVRYTAHTPNDPIGVAHGLAPGRVVWVHDPDVTDWAGPNSGELWYEHIDQTVATDMMSWALRGYAEEGTDGDAWDDIFSSYNNGSSYQSGEKIFIKINLVTVGASGGYADANYNPIYKSGVTQDSTANSPQLLLALLDQLVNEAGVAQTDITIGDPTGYFVNFLYNPLHDVFPDVHYEDNRGTLGRSKAVYTNPCVEFYWSTSDAVGKTQDCVIQS
ncbi:MAG: hypothetical protein ACK2TV_15165, partial [Anaerolineales bacterium]